MVREKVARRGERRLVVYSAEQWRLLEEKRARALELLEALAATGLRAIVHGSVARGDVHRGSDIDVFIPYTVPPFMVELALERAGYRAVYKLVVQATPHSTPKAYIVLDVNEERVVSFPLAKLGKTEYEFYFFGGALELEALRRGVRVPGVDKRLMLIEPVKEGHVETSIIGRESEAARKVGVSLETVLERVRVLTRRDEHGRTGVFVRAELEPWDSIEEAVRELARRNPVFRRALREKGSPLI